jgi:hypothetical protein
VTISSSIRKAGPFPGNGVTTAFPFTFKVFSTADVLAVQAVTLTGAETALALGANYTVSLNADQNANPGGTVTALVAPPTGETITLASQVPDSQGVDLTNLGGFYPTVINDALDRATIQIQQLAEKVDRSVKVGISSSATPDQLIASIQAGAASASADAATATAAAGSASAAASAASGSALDAAASAALINPANFATAAQGVKADSAVQTNALQTFTASQRGTTTTDNDLSFDLNVTNNFKCTPAAGGTLTFTNITAGQSGFILLVNGANYAIAAAATTKVGASTLATISATGTYLLSYFSDGTNVYVVASGTLA